MLEFSLHYFGRSDSSQAGAGQNQAEADSKFDVAGPHSSQSVDFGLGSLANGCARRGVHGVPRCEFRAAET